MGKYKTELIEVVEFSMIFLFALLCLNSASVVAMNSSPVIIWASAPVEPDETVLIQAGNFSENATIELAQFKNHNPKSTNGSNTEIEGWTSVEILQRGVSSLKCLVPSNWAPGVYACRMSDNGFYSETVFLNAAKAWWIQGDQGETASSGGWIRLVGNCLKINSQNEHTPMSSVQIRDLSGNFLLSLPIESCDPFDIQARIPDNVVTGTHQIWVHNGFGGEFGWSHAGEIAIAEPKIMPNAEFNVKALGLETALQKARENGGGTIYFPFGEYKMESTIEVPENTIIRGDGMEQSIIFWQDLEKIPEALIFGESLQIKSLSIYCQNMYHYVLKAEGGSVKMDSVRIRANPFYRLGRIESETTFRGRTLNGKLDKIGAAIFLKEVNGFQISNCDVYGYRGIKLTNSSNGIIRESKFEYGRGGFGCEAGKFVIIEDCIFEGSDMAASGNHFATFFGNSGEFLYLKGNRFANAYGLDQEFFTFDGTGGAYIGKVNKIDGALMTLASDPVFKRYAKNANDWRNTVVCILDGKGAGQYRRVKSHSGRDWEVDRPWQVEPDTSSIFSIIPFRGHTILAENTFIDGGAVQLYGISIENIISGNNCARMLGFSVYGQESRGWGWQPSWYNQILDNNITDGHNYMHGPTKISVVGVVGKSQIGDYEGPLSKCTVIRNNKIQSNGQINISGQSDDVLIEKNLLENSKFGIVVEKTLQSDVLLRYNEFENVENHYSGKAIEKATIVPVKKQMK